MAGLAMMLCLPGCGGCRKTPEGSGTGKEAGGREGRKEERKGKRALRGPAAGRDALRQGFLAGACKPGHWISQVWPEVKANRGDFQGELQTEIVDSQRPQAAAGWRSLRIDHRAARRRWPRSSRSRWNRLPGSRREQDAHAVNFKLAAGGGGPAVHGDASWRCTRMPSYRYYFVVLSQAAGRYEYLDKKLASIHLHRSTPRPTWGRSTMRWCRCRPGRPVLRSTAEPADQRLVLDEHRLSALGRLRPGAMGRRSTAGPDRLAALGRADHRQRPRCPGATPQQLSGALPAGQRGEVANFRRPTTWRNYSIGLGTNSAFRPGR